MLTAAIGRHKQVSLLEQVRKLVDREEAIVELDGVAQPELEDAPLQHQPIPLSLWAGDVRMRATRDHVDDLRVARDDCRQRVDHRLETFAGGDQSESGKQEAIAPRRTARRTGGETGRCSVRHHAHLHRRAGARGNEQPLCRLRHHDHELRPAAELGEPPPDAASVTPAGPRGVGRDDCRAHARRYERPCPCIRCGSCKPPLTDVRVRKASLVFARSRSSTRFSCFLTVSLPLTTPPKRQAAGSCGSQNTGTLRITVAEIVRVRAVRTGNRYSLRARRPSAEAAEAPRTSSTTCTPGLSATERSPF
jgi:hypothetical protein